MAKINKGPLYIALAAVLWSLAGIGAKYVPWSPMAITCVRGIVAAITLGCLRRSFRVKLNLPTVLAALCLAATTILFITANKMTTAANAIVLQYTAPVYVILFSALALRKRPRLPEIVTVLITMGGVALFFMDRMGSGSLTGDLLALLSGVTFASVFFLNSLPKANPQDASFLGCALTALLLPFVLTDPAVVGEGWVPWLVVVLMGIFQLGLAYYFFSKGIQKTGAVAATIISTSEPVLNPLWVFLFIGERPGALPILGGVIVIVTICAYNVIVARRKDKEAAA